MTKITIEDTGLNMSVTGQFHFVETIDGAAYDYMRRCADMVARQFFLAPVNSHLVLAVDKTLVTQEKK